MMGVETNQQLQFSGRTEVLERDDAALVRAAADGDECAWSALVQRFAELVWTIANAYGLDAADAADVSKVTWLRLGQHLRRLPEPAHVRMWLAQTARQESIRALHLSSRVTGRNRPPTAPAA